MHILFLSIGYFEHKISKSSTFMASGNKEKSSLVAKNVKKWFYG